MTDEQFKQLMEKLDQMQREMQAGQWNHLYRQPLPAPAQPYDMTPAHWRYLATD